MYTNYTATVSINYTTIGGKRIGEEQQMYWNKKRAANIDRQQGRK